MFDDQQVKASFPIRRACIGSTAFDRHPTSRHYVTHDALQEDDPITDIPLLSDFCSLSKDGMMTLYG